MNKRLKGLLTVASLALIATVALAAAGDLTIPNPNLDKDVLVTVNDGGVIKTPIKVVGSTGEVEIDSLIPAGMVMMYAGAALPAGYTWGNGVAITRTGVNARLFAALGTLYGVGNGSTTFNPPDCRGRVMAGQDDAGTSSANRLTSPINGDTLGAAGGDEDVAGTNSGTQALAHTHTTAHTHTEGSYIAQLTANGFVAPMRWITVPGWNATHYLMGNHTNQTSAGSSGPHHQGVGVDGVSGPSSAASSGPASPALTVNGANFTWTQGANRNMQPTIIFNCIVKL